ncbi:MAG: metallophosphoesterase [Acidobacteriaceae bacterium]
MKLNFLLFVLLFLSVGATAQTTIIQISDTHLGEPRAPHAAENLRRVVEMVNHRHPDAVVVTGDIGENPEQWQQAKSILHGVKAKLYYIPGNHDVHSNDVDRYRRAFGDDYYRVRIKNVVLYAIDSELLGNFDVYTNKDLAATRPSGLARQEGERMLAWLEKQRAASNATIAIGMQHVPAYRDPRVLSDTKPYWVLNEPDRTREIEALKRLGIRHMLVGHWHHADVFDYGGITWHVAPATSWLPWGGELGFAVHTITPDGNVKTDFIYLDHATE